MSATTELDAILREWLSEGPEHAPADPVRYALQLSERTGQRRPIPAVGFPVRVGDPTRLRSLSAVLGAAVLLVVLGVGIGIQVGLIRLPRPEPDPLPIVVPSPEPSRQARPNESAEPSTEPSPTVPASEQAFETFRAPDGSFDIQLPAEWELKDGPDATALYLGNGTTELSIRAGDAAGRVRTCDTGAAGWETCTLVQPATLDELADAIGLDADWPTAFVGPSESAASLDGVPATETTIVASHAGRPIGVQYVVAMHDGRPFVVRASRPMPPESDLGLMQLLEGLEIRTP